MRIILNRFLCYSTFFYLTVKGVRAKYVLIVLEDINIPSFSPSFYLYLL